MEFRFAGRIKELGRLPPEVLTNVFTASNRTEEDKEEFVMMLREFSNASVTVNAEADDEPPMAKARIRASRKDIVLETIGKMRRKLTEYERNHDRIDKWVIDFAIGEDYAGRTLDYIKEQHAR